MKHHTLIYINALLIALLMAIASIAGLLLDIYSTEEFRLAFMPTDVSNLVIGLPILLGSVWLAWRRQLVGLLLLLGGLFYVVYIYIVYLIAIPVHEMFLIYLALTTLSLYTMISLFANMESRHIAQQLRGHVFERPSAVILIAFGSLFFLRVIAIGINAINSQASISIAEKALLIADFMMTPAWVIGGLLLWKKANLSYVFGLGLLFLSSMLFIGLIIFLIVQPVLTDAAFAPIDLVIVFLMGMVSFVPFVLFLRGVLSRQNL